MNSYDQSGAIDTSQSVIWNKKKIESINTVFLIDYIQSRHSVDCQPVQ